jgi:glycosyltransferase involved in cell wall biosynthesis
MSQFLWTKSNKFEKSAEYKYKVCIITRTKNRIDFLRRALRSISEQTFTDWQLIIVNDGGCEVEEAVRSSLDHNQQTRLIILNNPVSRGMEAASNIGLAHAAAEFVCLLDDDDTWDRRFLEKTISFLDSDVGSEFIGVAVRSKIIEEVYENGKFKTLRSFVYNEKQKAISFRDLLAVNSFFVNAFVYRAEAVKIVGGYNEQLPVIGDWEFNIRMLMVADIGFLNEVLAFYHQRPNDNTSETGNTITRDYTKHAEFDARLRSRLLRRAFAEDPKLVGTALLNQHSYFGLSQQINELQADMTAIKKRIDFLLWPVLTLHRIFRKIKRHFS